MTPFQTRRSDVSIVCVLRKDMSRVRYPNKKVQTAFRVQVPHGWAQLIRKLRWIGLEQEAKRLEIVLSTMPVGRQPVLAGQGRQKS